MRGGGGLRLTKILLYLAFGVGVIMFGLFRQHFNEKINVAKNSYDHGVIDYNSVIFTTEIVDLTLSRMNGHSKKWINYRRSQSERQWLVRAALFCFSPVRLMSVCCFVTTCFVDTFWNRSYMSSQLSSSHFSAINLRFLGLVDNWTSTEIYRFYSDYLLTVQVRNH